MGDARQAKDEQTSKLELVEAGEEDPLRLFARWKDEAHEGGAIQPQSMVLATASGNGVPDARTVVLRRLAPDGFVLMTDKRSRKCSEMSENPKAAIVFLWLYKEKDGRTVNRQVRAGGDVERLPREEALKLFAREPFYCQVRAHLCNQGAAVEWSDAKRKHDELVEAHRCGEIDLTEMPDHVVAYKLIPDWVEFYGAHDDSIGDRVLYRREGDTWSSGHIYA